MTSGAEDVPRVHARPILGVGACLLGGRSPRCRGAEDRNAFLADVLAPFVEYRPRCLISKEVDFPSASLCGWVIPGRSGGECAARMEEFAARLPFVPSIDSLRLADPVLRESFVERLFVMARWRALETEGFRHSRLLEFHARHKLLLMAHGIPQYRALGRLVGLGGGREPAVLAAEYCAGLMEALADHAATVKKNVNVLDHAMGYFKRKISSDEKRALRSAIEAYARGNSSLGVPVDLLNRYVRKFRDVYLAGQFFLDPYPAELGLRDWP